MAQYDVRPFNHRWDDGRWKYFITYYGDIYHGCVQTHHQYDDRFFILSKNQLQEFQGLTQEQRTLKKYSELAWELRDDSAIIETFNDSMEIGGLPNHIDTTRNGHQEWKKMFVFGAGASANCVFEDKIIEQFRNSSFKPPVGIEIFDTKYKDLIKKYPGVRASIPVYMDKKSDVESGIEKEWEEIRYYNNLPVIKRHINIQFYLQELCQQISEEVKENFFSTNLYGLFAHKLQNQLSHRGSEKAAIVSFNYDTILEDFVAPTFDLDLSHLKGYIDYNNKQAVYFKPHGSCNWGWQFRKDRLTGMNGSLPDFLFNSNYNMSQIYYWLLGDLVEMAGNWGYEKSWNPFGVGKYSINKNRIQVIPNGMKNAHFPAMLLPYRDKDEFVMHYDHYEAMKWFIHEMEELYLIGWKGNEALFNRIIKQQAYRLKKIVIVNPNGEEVRKNLGDDILKKCANVQVIDSFEEFVRVEMDKIFAE